MRTLRHHVVEIIALFSLVLVGPASVAMAQTGEITGTVTDESASPVVGLTVELLDEHGNGVASALTDSFGDYSFSGLSDGIYLVRVNSNVGLDVVGEYYLDVNEYDTDLATRLEISGGNTLTGIDLELGPGGSISGSLFGLAGGEDIDLYVYELWSGRHRGGTRSSGGTYTINNLPPSGYKLFAEPLGTDRAYQWWDGKLSYNTADTILLGADADIVGRDFTLAEGSAISGTITLDPDPGDSGGTLQQIWVEAFDAGSFDHVRSVGVASDGTYTVANLPPGGYLIQAQSSNTSYIREMWVTGANDPYQEPVFHMNEAEPVTITAASPATGIDFLLELGRSISGNVWLDGFGYVENASISADGMDVAFWGGNSTDASGDFTVWGLAPGQYRVRVESASVDVPFTARFWQDKSLDETPDPVDVSLVDASGIDFTVTQDRRISGKVFIDANNDQVQQAGENGFPNVTVRVYDFSDGRWLGHAAVAPDGRYSVGVLPGVYMVEASPHQQNLLQEYWQNAFFSQLATAVDVSSVDASDIDFGLVEGAQFGTLRGRVVIEGTSTGIPDVDVQLRFFDTEQGVANTATDATGYFEFQNLPPSPSGGYKILFATEDTNAANGTDYIPAYWSSSGDERIDFPAVLGDGTDVGTFELERGGSIYGVVYPPGGDSLPLPFYVELQNAYGGMEPLPNAAVQADGGYHIRGVPAGVYRVRASLWGTDFLSVYYFTPSESCWHWDCGATVEMTPPAAIGGIDIHLERGGSISGLVTLAASGEPLPEIQVNTNLMNDPQGRGYGIGTRTLEDGTYVLRGLPTGDYLVRTDDRSGLYANETYPSLVTVAGFDEEPGIDFELTAPASILGVVFEDLDDDGSPDPGEGRSGAQIDAFDWATGEWMGGAISIADGSYEIQGLGAGTYQVQLAPNETNFLRMFYDNDLNQPTPVEITEAGGLPQDATNIDFRIVPGFEISGFVFWDTDADGVFDVGEPPLNSANVAADKSDGTYGSGTGTNADGTFTIHGLPPGAYHIRAHAPNFLQEYWLDAYYPEDAAEVDLSNGNASGINLSLVDGASTGTLRGRVVIEGTSTGIPDVDVQLRFFDTEQGVANTATDANGYFEFHDLVPAPAGGYKIYFDTGWSNIQHQTDHVASYWAAAAETGIIDPSDMKIVFPTLPDPQTGPGTDLKDFELATGGSISGQVHPPDGETLPPDITVSAQSFESGGAPLPHAEVDGSGLYHLRGLPAPATYRVIANTGNTDLTPMYFWTATESTFDYGTAAAVDVGVATEEPGIEIFLQRGGSISGTVRRAADGQPLPNIPVSANLANDPLGRGYGCGASTDADGTYTLRGLPDGEYQVRTDARDAPYANETYPAMVTVTAPNDTSGIDFDLEAGGRVTGRVTYLVGGAAEAVVNIRVEAADFATGAFVSDGYTDADGYYAIGALTQGHDYRVHVQPWNHPDPQFHNFISEFWNDELSWDAADPVTVPVDTGGGSEVPGIDFVIELGGAISGLVTAAGSPLQNVNVSAGQTDAPYYGNNDATDQNGFYMIRGLPAGDYLVNANPWPLSFVGEYFDDTTQWHLATPVPVPAVPEGGPIPITGSIDFDLGPAFSISGRVTEADGTTPIPGIFVSAGGLDVAWWNQAPTDSDGDYVIRNLPPGSYQLTVETGGTDYMRQWRQVDLTEGDAVGQDFALEPGASISGLVYVDDNANGTYDAGEERADVQISASDYFNGWYLAGATTDQNGLYEIRGLGAGTYSLHLDGGLHNLVPMYYIREFSWGAVQPVDIVDPGTGPQNVTGIDFEGLQGSEIRGVVFYDTDGDGIQDPGEDGLPNIAINAEFQGPFWVDHLWTNSSSDGGYTLHGLYPGLHTVSAHAGGTPFASEYYKLVGGQTIGTSTRSEADHVDTSSGDVEGIDLSLDLGGSIAGTVRDAGSGVGLDTVDVYVNRFDDDGLWWGTSTDLQGRYEVNGLPPGEYRVEARDRADVHVGEYHFEALFWEDSTPVYVVARSAVNDPLATPVDFDLDEGGAIAGVVYADIDGDGFQDPGEPGIDGIGIHLVEFADPGRYIKGSSTGPNGSFVVGGLPPELDMRVSVDGWGTDFIGGYYDGGDDAITTDYSQAWPLSVSAGSTTSDIDFGLSEGGSITGLVLDGDGTPIQGMWVNANSPAWGVGDSTDSQGRYHLRGLLPGDYQVSTGGNGYVDEWYDNQSSWMTYTPVAVAAGSLVEGVDFVLPLIPRITGGPTNASGERGSTVTGVTLDADQLSTSATVVLGDGLEVQNLNRVGDTFTFDVVIASDAPLGGHSVSVVNLQALEDGIDTVVNAFQVLPATGDVPASSATRLYVADSGQSQVRVYGTADLSHLATIDLCCRPTGITLSPDASFAYTNGAHGRLSVIDTRLGDAGEEVARFELFGISGYNAMAATADYIYAIDQGTGAGQLVVIDPQTWTVHDAIPLGVMPYALALDPVGQAIFVASNSTDSLVIVDVDPGSATFHDIIATVDLPALSRPRDLAVTADGSRVLVACNNQTFVVDTGLAVSDPANAVVAELPQLRAPIDIAHHAASGIELAYLQSGGLIAVVDISPELPAPKVVRTFAAGFEIAEIAATPDTLYVQSGAAFDLWAVDLDGLLTGDPLPMTRFDGPEPPDGLGYLYGGVAVGATPSAPPVGAPAITGVAGAAATGSPFTLTIDGSNFDLNAVVRLQGTVVQGVVTSATPTRLTVEFPASTPSGEHRLVVTNPVPGGGVSGLSPAPINVALPAGLVTSQTVYVSGYGSAKLGVYHPDGSTSVVPILPFAGGIAITPDGDLGFVVQAHDGPWSSYDDLPEHFYDMAAIDLDPDSPTYLQVLRQIPWIWSSYCSPEATPNLDNPNGIRVYVPNSSQADTVSVIDPTTLAEVDLDDDPATSSLPRNHPYSWIPNGDAMAGINRIELDGNLTDRSLWPTDVALTPDGSLLYVANLRGSVSIVDTVTYAVVGTLTANGDLSQAREVVITPTDSGSGVFVYVLGIDSVGDPFLFIFEAGNTDDATALVGQVPLPLFPRSMAITEDGGTVFVAAVLGYPDLSTEVYVIDVRPEQRLIADQFGVPGRIYKLATAANDELLYLTVLWGSEVFVVDISPGSGYPLVATLQAPACPLDVAVEPSQSVIAPVVGGVSPDTGSPSGGEPVVISGANFAPGATVEFGAGNPSTEAVVQGSYAIAAVTPASMSGEGPVDVIVTNTDGRSDVLPNGFTYEVDATPPVFTTPPYVAGQALVGQLGSETATVEIRWTTDEASDSRVDFRQGGLAFLQAVDPSPVTKHLITLAGLSPATDYEFFATSGDSEGNDESSPVPPLTTTFTTPTAPDSTPPQILSGPTVSATTDEALIQWETNELATSIVQYDSQINGMPLLQAFGANGLLHSVNLTGLLPSTEYEFKVVSVDASGNGPTSSPISSFTTNALPDQTPPVITWGPEPTYLASDLVIIRWRTDDLSTSFVNYGTSSIHEQGVVDLDMTTDHVVFLTNLLPGTVYGYQVGSTDSSGNTVLSADPFAKSAQKLGTARLEASFKAGVVTLEAGTYLENTKAASGFTTLEAPDTAAPGVASLSVEVLSYDRVLVTVTANEDASLRAHFGVSGLTDSAFNPAFSGQPSLLLTGLAGATTYQLAVELTDPKGNTATYNADPFTTPTEPDTTPPAISGLTVDSVTDTSARLLWTTDESADATVRYGEQGGALSHQVGRLGLRTAHEIYLTGLEPGTVYDAEASSRDASGNSGAATTSFTTLTARPIITSVTPARAAQGAAVEIAINGTNFDGSSHVGLGADVAVDSVNVNTTGSQIRATVTVEVDADIGVRQLVVTTVGGTASAGFMIVDTTVPEVEILSPSDNAELLSLTVAVHGTISELAAVKVNGNAATVTNGDPIYFDATITLPGAGIRGITAAAQDPSGNLGTHTITVIITNQPPVASAGGPYTVNEGTPLTLDGSGSYDDDGTITSYRWDLDADGEYDDAEGVSVQHTFFENGSYSVALEVTDDSGADDIASSSVSVINVAPTVGLITAPGEPLEVNTPFETSAPFTDAGSDDTHTAVWDWDDTTITDGVVTEANGSGTVTGGHVYGEPGVYTVSATVMDDDGAAGVAVYQYVVVYDPSAGFVTGGGWIESPAGAYAPDPSLSGKATFGFVSKYKKGTTTPVGSTEFEFETAGLSFVSTGYEWLVVTGGDYAKFKGTGLLNGADLLKFMVWAGDDDPDTFRIKIWDEDEAGNETTIYDNGMDQPIGGGSIVVHTK